MNRYQSKMNFAVKSKARSFATMGAGFVDQIETLKMEERLQLMKKTMEQEREERKNRGGQFWKSGQKGKLTTYANTVLQSKLSNKKVGKVKMLVDEQLQLPTRNESSTLSKKLSDISNNPTGTTYKPSTKNNMRMCGQCESNEAALCCIQCTEVYCTMCFSTYHKKGALRKHRSISLEVSSTPRSKPPNSEKRLSDVTLLSMTTDATSELDDSRSPSGASGALSLMDGNYNEAESAASFQEALLAWRMKNQSSGVAGAAAAAAAVASIRGSVAAAPSGANTMEIPSSQPKPKSNEGIYTNTSTNTTKRTDSLASLMENTQNNTLSYAERLLVKKNRRTPISWEKGTLDATNQLENKDHSKRMESSDIEQTSNVLDSVKTPERFSIDEPVTFSSLYNLVAQDTEESNKSNIQEQEELFPETFKNTRNELPEKSSISKSTTEDFPQHRINVVPLDENFAEKPPPNSSTSQSEEKTKTKIESTRPASSSSSSHQSGKKTLTSQIQFLKKQSPKSKPSLSTFRSTNLTTTPSEELKMVCQLAKSQYTHDEEQQSSLLMAGLSGDAMTNTGEVDLSERRTSLKSNTGVIRPATTVKVSYSLYKMSPRSWHPDQSISQNLSDNKFHLNEGQKQGVSDKSRQERNNIQSDPNSIEVQKVSSFDHPPNTIRPTSTTCEESAIIITDEGQAREEFPANSAYNEDLQRTDSTLGVISDPLQMMITNPSHDLTCLNNNAIMSQDLETCDSVSPNSLAKEYLKERSPIPIRTGSTTPIHSVRRASRSKTMSPITTRCSTNEDDLATRIYSARSTPRNKSISPDPSVKKMKDSLSTPVHSVKSSPRCKTISPIPLEINSEDNVSPVLSLKSSATPVDSVRNTQRDESPIPTVIDVSNNFSDTPVLSVTNTSRSYTMSSVPTIIEGQINHLVTPSHSLKYTPRSKTVSTIQTDQDPQEKKCDTPSYSLKYTPRSKTVSTIQTPQDPQENKCDTPSYSLKYTPRSKTLSTIQTPQYPQENKCDTPSHSLKYTPRSKTVSTIQTDQDPQEKKCDTPSHSLKYTPRSKTVSTIQTDQDPQEKKCDTPSYSLKYTPRSKTVSTIQTDQDPQEKKCDTPSHSLKYTPRSKTVSTIQTDQDLQENKFDTPSYSLKYTPRSKTMSTIQTHQDNQEKRSGTPIYSAKNTPRYQSMSPTSTELNMQLKSSDPPTSSFPKIDAEETLSLAVYSSKSLPRTKSTSPISNVVEDLFDTPGHSSRSSQRSCKTPSSIATVIEIQDTIYADKDTSMNKTESPISTIIDTQEGIFDTHVHSPIPTIIEKQLNSSVSPALSSSNTPRTDRSLVTAANSQLKEFPMSNDEEKDKDLHYNARIYQMLVNKELDSYTLDSTDNIVPVLPKATNQDNIAKLEGPSSSLCTPFIVSSTEMDTASSDYSTILTSNATLPSTSVPSTCSSESPTRVLSREPLPLYDKLATTFYMCNSEMYHTYDSELNSDSTPILSGATLNKGPPSTKKYVIRRPPKIPDETNPQNPDFSGNDVLQPKPPALTLSVLEMKRINFKQSNQDQNIVSFEEIPNSEQKIPFSDMSRLSLSSQGEKLNSSAEDHESVFSSLTKISVDSLDDRGEEEEGEEEEEEEEEISENLFNEEEFLISDDLQAEIDEMEDQIAEEMKVKALK